MDSKKEKEIEIGDYVIYNDSGKVVYDEDTKCPLKVIEIGEVLGEPTVMYENGEYDFLRNVEKASPLLLELL